MKHISVEWSEATA